MTEQKRPDYYVVDKELRIGVYPGEHVATFNSHWEACDAMIKLGNADAS